MNNKRPAMQLPETRNAQQLHAFKKGFRAALEGKTLDHMPSVMRYDPLLRDYFQQGWEQAQETLAEVQEQRRQVPWRNRFAWWLVMAVGGLATGAVLIHNIEQSKQAPVTEDHTRTATPSGAVTAQPSIPPEAVRPTGSEGEVARANRPQAKASQTGGKAAQLKPASAESGASVQSAQIKDNAAGQPLALLTAQQRQDLEQSRKEAQSAGPAVALKPIQDSTIGVSDAQLTTAIHNKMPTERLADPVPKNIRKLYFFTRIENASGKTVYHRWLFNQREMALIPLPIHSNLYRTWSSKRLTSAWQGQWHVEVLDADKRVIERHTFNYGH